MRWQTDKTTNADTCHQITCGRRNEGAACRTVASMFLAACTDCFGRNFNRIDDGLFFNAAFFEFPAHHAGKRTSAAGCFGNISPAQEGRVNTVSGSQTADERDIFSLQVCARNSFAVTVSIASKIRSGFSSKENRSFPAGKTVRSR